MKKGDAVLTKIVSYLQRNQNYIKENLQKSSPKGALNRVDRSDNTKTKLR
jgi:bifunctional pyridoxal-dependent enzyme with beta-cystathionase and maltose regulon repressor activities